MKFTLSLKKTETHIEEYIGKEREDTIYESLHKEENTNNFLLMIPFWFYSLSYIVDVLFYTNGFLTNLP